MKTKSVHSTQKSPSYPICTRRPTEIKVLTRRLLIVRWSGSVVAPLVWKIKKSEESSKETAECTFRPRIRSRRYPNQNMQRRKWYPKTEKRMKEIAVEKENQFIRSCTFAPSINPNSRKLAVAARRNPRFVAQRPQEQPTLERKETPKFAPVVNEISEDMPNVNDYIQSDPFDRLYGTNKFPHKERYCKHPEPEFRYTRVETGKMDTIRLHKFLERLEIQGEQTRRRKQKIVESAQPINNPALSNRSRQIVAEQGKSFKERLEEKEAIRRQRNFEIQKEFTRKHPFRPKICSKSSEIVASANVDDQGRVIVRRRRVAFDSDLTFSPNIKRVNSKHIQKASRLEAYLKQAPHIRLAAGHYQTDSSIKAKAAKLAETLSSDEEIFTAEGVMKSDR
eukprot:458406_1